MQVTLKKDWLGKKSGSKVVVNNTTGFRLIESGIAKVTADELPSNHVVCTKCGAFIKLNRTMKAKKDEVVSNEETGGKEQEGLDTFKAAVSAGTKES